jgi:hypothetical protein
VDVYRNKTRAAIESIPADVRKLAPLYETRVGKRIVLERIKTRDNSEARGSDK